jgi:uncharacterized protein (TIGR03435 family)
MTASFLIGDVVRRRPWLPALVVAAIACGPQMGRAQTPATDKLEFQVASVKQDKTGDKPYMNIDPTSGDMFTPTGGLYSARNIVLISYISFAYKLTNKQLQSAVEQTPWLAQARFDIEARAEGDPSKDQYRAMMRALLADRFKLAAHFETREADVFGLKQVQPGKLGPQLRMHRADDPVCSGSAPPPADADRFPEKCGAIIGMKPSSPGRMKEGARNVPVSLMASVLTGVGNLGRPMIDDTEIDGNVDFYIEWAQVAANVPNGTEFHPDESAPAFETALKEQLGLKLVAKKSPVSFFVVDHMELPSLN